MQNWSCMHLCGHSSVKFLWSCDARAHDSFPLFLVNPMFPKYVLLSICAFIRVHFGRPGKFSQHSPFRCTHIFQKLAMISEFFKEKLEVISFQKHVGFSARQLIFLFLTCSLFSFFFLLALFFPYLLSSFQFIFIFIFIMIFVCFTYIFF